VLGKLSKLGWYWHRLWAMSPVEIARRMQKRVYQFSDAKYRNQSKISLDADAAFPNLPPKDSAPAELREALRRDAEAILNGDWRAFGHLPLKLDDPPRWQFDYLAGQDFQSSVSAFRLDHRAKPNGADIKLIWEPSRWNQLVRLALAGWLLGDVNAREKCVEWLLDWARKNPPFTGLNWTSGLETGLRLVQFTWIDGLLAASGVPEKTLRELRGQILPPHVWYTWRYKSSGSSANNHLIGELAGLIVAMARWPQLSHLSRSIDGVARILEEEILAQFAPDGGNLEQAHGYHLFSWEFCWQCQQALERAGSPLSPEVKERLAKAGEFYAKLKPPGDVWDYGDCDNAWVTPLFAEESQAPQEWREWFCGGSPVLRYWWGEFPGKTALAEGEWVLFKEAGHAVFKTKDWFARLDFSPLGMGSIAAHGHLDALHFSLWHQGHPVIIDPGTGAYYAEKAARNYLADWEAHNSPHLKDPPAQHPKRLGTFMWGASHAVPKAAVVDRNTLAAELLLPYGKMIRTVRFLPEANAFWIEDRFAHSGSQSAVVTRWKFPPGAAVRNVQTGLFRVDTPGAAIRLDVGPSWQMSRTYSPPEQLAGKTAFTLAELGNAPIESIVSPAFRRLAAAPYLALESTGEGPFELTISPG